MKIKHNIKSRLLAGTLALSMLFSLTPTPIYAADDGTVTESVAEDTTEATTENDNLNENTEVVTEVTTETPTTEKTTEVTTEKTTEVTTEATTEVSTEKEEVTTEKEAETTTEKATEEPAKTSDETVTIVVESGMYSEEVAERLMEAGIIDDAYDFNIWLESTGYATALEVGEFQVKKGMSYEEIAQVLTRAY